MKNTKKNLSYYKPHQKKMQLKKKVLREKPVRAWDKKDRRGKNKSTISGEVSAST